MDAVITIKDQNISPTVNVNKTFFKTDYCTYWHSVLKTNLSK